MSTGGHARISPETLDLKRAFGSSRRVYVIEERDDAGRWSERARYASFHDAADALDHLSVGSDRNLRIRALNPRHRLHMVAAALAVVVVLAGIAWILDIVLG